MFEDYSEAWQKHTLMETPQKSGTRTPCRADVQNRRHAVR